MKDSHIIILIIIALVAIIYASGNGSISFDTGTLFSVESGYVNNYGDMHECFDKGGVMDNGICVFNQDKLYYGG